METPKEDAVNRHKKEGGGDRKEKQVPKVEGKRGKGFRRLDHVK